MWYDYAIERLSAWSILSENRDCFDFEKENDALSENSYIWVIGELVKRGLLKHEGRNKCALADGGEKDIYSPLYSEETGKVEGLVEKQYPFIGFTLFESVLLNEFLNHQIARNAVASWLLSRHHD